MADFAALDETQPDGTDLASTLDDVERELRDTLKDWAYILATAEHDANGKHLADSSRVRFDGVFTDLGTFGIHGPIGNEKGNSDDYNIWVSHQDPYVASPARVGIRHHCFVYTHNVGAAVQFEKVTISLAGEGLGAGIRLWAYCSCISAPASMQNLTTGEFDPYVYPMPWDSGWDANNIVIGLRHIRATEDANKKLATGNYKVAVFLHYLDP